MFLFWGNEELGFSCFGFFFLSLLKIAIFWGPAAERTPNSTGFRRGLESAKIPEGVRDISAFKSEEKSRLGSSGLHFH